MQELLERIRTYMPPDRVRLVEDALAYAVDVHAGQLRKSGAPYIDHPVSAARYLADLSLDAPTIAAALLHDVIEDCGVSVEDLRSRFGADVARLVDGVTKLTKLDSLVEEGVRSLKPTSGDAESLRKMLVAMAEDIRVVLIKLADRLHNMRTLEALPPDRRVAIAQETLDIYAPLAHRLGMGEVKWQLEDLSFRYLQPNQYRAISQRLSTKRREREEYIAQVTEVLRRELARAGFDADITGRPKHLYSIHRKEQAYAAQGKQVSDIHDLFAVRVLVETVQDCYGALGAVHALWRPLPGSFDDYIASPKENMYQSLHTTVRAIGGLPVEVQVRTREMHRTSEYGIASHWSYKEGDTKDQRFEERMTWLRQLLEWQREVSATEEFLESVKMDIFRDQVFVYTPKNEIKELPNGATPIDFAYRIHTELGHRCIGAKVNGRLVSLDTQLRNGDTVEVLTSKVARGPSLDWLNLHAGYAKTAGARHAIRQWFRRQERGANIERGREQLRRELRRLNAQVDEAELARIFGYEGAEEFLAAVGASIVSMAQVAGRLAARTEGPPAPLVPAQPAPKGVSEGPTGITVLGVGDLLTRMAACCTPVPGDEIIGFITRTRGVSVHRRDCSNIRAVSEPERLVEVGWGTARNVSTVRIRIEAFDRVGLLHELTGAVSSEGVNISASSTEMGADGEVVVHITVQVGSLEQLSRLFNRVEAVRGVRSASRAIPGDTRAAGSR
jgi:guanosine-3',5'-bis(diphosphate) 3'-pyrophosphohydrolase